MANAAGAPGTGDTMAAMRQDFLDFFDTEYVLVVRFLMRTGASLADAEDAAQHMAVQGWRKVQRGRWSQIANPPAWARTVALNHHRARLHGRSEIPLDLGIDSPGPGPGHAELTGQARDLVTLLQLLDDDCRAVIAFDLDDIPADQIVAALGKTPQQVRDLRKKARKKLKEHLHAPARREGGIDQ
ncbi:sigma-70 family RNA polymerase sigma factor [Actinomadura rubrisoli]|uniref:sigma-70 family RNA polymerase sigma factor n=1 Tax=Actinomadura rubrisoli TaxID=2530368 RepID=UPI00140544EC|nr:sigma-70 family RNA polymerase sigma factor [Actinomadura rubrisoli]